MKHPPWLYLPPEAWPAGGDGPVPLPEGEARHAFGALRLRDGAEAVVFDGNGRVASAHLHDDGGGRTLCTPETPTTAPRWRPRLTVAVAVPKGKRAAWMVEKCTEAGVDAFQPLWFERSVAGAGEEAPVAAKWREWSLAACKQCRRAWRPKLFAPMTLVDWLARRAEAEDAASADRGDDARALSPVLFGMADGQAFAEWSGAVSAARAVTAVIGPEGGFTPAEEEALRAAGAVPARWGLHVLRVETAAVAACVAAGLLRRERSARREK